MTNVEGGRNRYVILTIVLAGVFMSVLDSVVVNIALPDITSYFNVTVADSQWVVITYLVAQTSFLIIAGKISERTGRARMFALGLAVFTISSLLCGLSTSLPQLIIFRLLQGLGASMLFSISAAIIFQVFGHQERGKAMGFLGSTVAVAAMVGPALGGFIVGSLGWQYIFLINVPIGIIALVAALKMLKLEERCVDCLRMDYAGAGLWVTTILFLVLMLGLVGQTGTLTSTALVFLIVFVTAFGLFIRRERRAAHPLLDISVFRVRRFTLAGLSMVMFFMSMSMVTILGPFYYEGVLSYRPEQVGLIFMVLPAVMMIGSPLAGRMYDRTHSPLLRYGGTDHQGLVPPAPGLRIPELERPVDPGRVLSHGHRLLLVPEPQQHRDDDGLAQGEDRGGLERAGHPAQSEHGPGGLPGHHHDDAADGLDGLQRHRRRSDGGGAGRGRFPGRRSERPPVAGRGGPVVPTKAALRTNALRGRDGQKCIARPGQSHQRSRPR